MLVPLWGGDQETCREGSTEVQVRDDSESAQGGSSTGARSNLILDRCEKYGGEELLTIR